MVLGLGHRGQFHVGRSADPSMFHLTIEPRRPVNGSRAWFALTVRTCSLRHGTPFLRCPSAHRCCTGELRVGLYGGC